jgi:hypothetical protein
MTKSPNILFVSWQDEVSRRIVPIGRLLRLGDGYEFGYIKAIEDAETLGFQALLSFPKLDAVYRSAALPPLFENRVMPRSRQDFPEHIAQLALDMEQAEPFTVLARTGGRRLTDRLEVFAPPVASGDSVEGVFLARGIRHVPGAEIAVAKLQPMDRLLVLADLQNAASRLALALRSSHCEMLGYVPDYLAEELGLLNADPTHLKVTALKVNPDPAPVHHRLLCHFAYPVAFGGADLFRGPRYAPVSRHATSLAA